MLGRPWPLFPISYPDAERQMPINPLYTYTSIPFAVASHGRWPARLPAVLWLWVAALGVGLCAFELTRRRQVGFVIGCMAALTPWLFVLGRVGWEAVSFPAVLSFAFWLLLKGGREERGGLLALSGFLFGLSIYAYTTARLIAPLTGVACFLPLARRAGVRRRAIAFLLPLFLMALPLIAQLVRDPYPITWRYERLSLSGQRPGAGPLSVGLQAAVNHLLYLSPDFLFLDGDTNPRHGTGRGVLLWSAAPLLAIGLWQLWRRRGEPELQALAIGLMLAPAGVALLAAEHPHAIRSIGASVFWLCLAAVGLGPILRRSRGRPAVRATLAAVAILEAALFLRGYFGPYRTYAYDAFDTGRVALLEEASTLRGGRHIYITPTSADDPGDGVLLAYLEGLPSQRWIREGLDRFGIHRYGGDAPPGSLILLRGGEVFPAGARLLSETKGPADGVRRYALYER